MEFTCFLSPRFWPNEKSHWHLLYRLHASICIPPLWIIHLGRFPTFASLKLSKSFTNLDPTQRRVCLENYIIIINDDIWICKGMNIRVYVCIYTVYNMHAYVYPIYIYIPLCEFIHYNSLRVHLGAEKSRATWRWSWQSKAGGVMFWQEELCWNKKGRTKTPTKNWWVLIPQHLTKIHPKSGEKISRIVQNPSCIPPLIGPWVTTSTSGTEVWRFSRAAGPI